MKSVKRRVFFSFHYEQDVWRAAQIRNAGTLDGNEPISDNDWEETKGSEVAIKKWIDDQMHTRSCTVVLIGSHTAGRDWIRNHHWNMRCFELLSQEVSQPSVFDLIRTYAISIGISGALSCCLKKSATPRYLT